jgi:hypothetical protein
MTKFRIGGPQESSITAWYNTKEGILPKLQSLEGFCDLIHARYEAGYQRDENLTDFYALGNWLLDSCGNCMKADRDINSLIPGIAPLLTREEFGNVTGRYMDNPMIGFSAGMDVPLPGLMCPVCGEEWSIHNCYDAIVYEGNSSEKIVSLDAFVGKPLLDVKLAFQDRKEAIYRMNQPELVIRNDRFIDLRPDPYHEEYNLKHPDSPIVFNQRGWKGEKDGIDNDYIVQIGDEAYVNIWKFYHRICNRQRINQDQLDEFLRIFTQAGFDDLDLRFLPIANQYCSCERCANWYKVNTVYGTGITIGWRKRVINIDWSAWGIDFSYLFQEEDVTKGPGAIHAWGEKKAIEYLSKIRKELDKPEVQKKIFEFAILSKVVNKEATIQNILDWVNASIGHSLNVKKFNEKMEDSNWEGFLIETAKYCGTKIVYC